MKWIFVEDSPSCYFLPNLRPNKYVRQYNVLDRTLIFWWRVKLAFRRRCAHSSRICKQNEDILRNRQERKWVLELITHSLLVGANAILDKTPDMTELERVLKGSPRRRVPNVDGLTTKVLVGC